MVVSFRNVKFANNPRGITLYSWVYGLMCYKNHIQICLPSAKACWTSETTLPTAFFNLLANTLYNPPTKLMGLKSFRSFIALVLGIKTKKVACKLLTKESP